MTILDMRLLDRLVDDEEQLEELLIGVSFTQRDKTFYRFRESFRLGEVFASLQKLETDGLVLSRVGSASPPDTWPFTLVYALTDKGRLVWKESVGAFTSLYDPDFLS